MDASDQILKLILEIHTTVQALDKKVDLFDQRLETHLQEDAAWQAKVLQKMPVPLQKKHVNGKLNGKARRKTTA